MRKGLSTIFVVALLASCATRPPEQRDVARMPDPIPKIEPRSALGNPPFYEVFGKRYFVLSTAAGYSERGVASWYGPGFHKEKTAMGDPYDMYAMTAAHKTLPLPCYVRVTNLSNGRSVVVRVNDRGPFKDDRIIDLSYTAAAKLDMIRAGTALVEVETVSVDGSRVVDAQITPPANSTAPLYVQAGAFADRANAERLVARLKAAGVNTVFIATDDRPRGNGAGRDMHRVRVGPVKSVADFDRIVAQLRSLGVPDARLAGD